MIKSDICSQIKSELDKLLQQNSVEKDTTNIDEISDIISGIIFKNKCNCELLKLQKDVDKISEIMETLQSTINSFLGEDKVTFKFDDNKLIISSGDNYAIIDLSSNSQLATLADINSIYKPFDANGHEYVDLGLPSGTLWATMNVGASNPEDTGGYYAWGQIYDWTQTQEKGTEDTDICGTQYDVAHVNWEGNWTIPTGTQIEELINNCTIDQIDTYFVVTSNINQNKIIFPDTGGYYESADKKQNLGMKISGICWSSDTSYNTSYSNGTVVSYNLWYHKAQSGWVLAAWNKDYNAGITVRPVITREFKYDSEIDDNSTNAVQNKVIKAYIDNTLKGNISIDEIFAEDCVATKYIKLYYTDKIHSNVNDYTPYIKITYSYGNNDLAFQESDTNYSAILPLGGIEENKTIAFTSDLNSKADLTNSSQTITTGELIANNTQTKYIRLNELNQVSIEGSSVENYTQVYRESNNIIFNPVTTNQAVTDSDHENHKVTLAMENLKEDQTIAYQSDITSSINKSVWENGYTIQIKTDEDGNETETLQINKNSYNSSYTEEV